MEKTINFKSVFDAQKASELFGWERHHKYGRLEFDNITEEQIKILKENKIGFWIEKRRKI